MQRVIYNSAEKLNYKILGYRSVPVNNFEIGETAKSVEPVMEMIFIEKPFDVTSDDDFERKLFILEIIFSPNCQYYPKRPNWFYVASMSCRKLIYKGQLQKCTNQKLFQRFNRS